MKIDKKLYIFAIMLIVCLSFGVKADEIDKFVENQMRNLHIPGASISIIRNDKVIKSKGYGFADLQSKSFVTPKTVYEIGSMTKQFTAVAVMMLVEEGKINLDDKIAKYFPDPPESWNKIKIRHLLTHASGIQNHVAVPDYMDIFRTSITGKTFPSSDELLKEFYKLPFEFAPEESWAYDNTGYHLLGTIIEKAGGKNYWQFLDERIFKPLKMNSTRNTDTQSIISQRASGYAWTENGWENRPILSPFIGFSAGSLLSTVEDLGKWDAALYGEKLLKKSSLEIMWTPARTNAGQISAFDYGFGWFIEKYRGHRNIMHSGGTPGFSSVMHRFDSDKLSIIILTNHADIILEQLALEIAGMYEPKLRYTESKAEKETTNKLKAVFGELLAGKFNPELFTPAMQIHLKTATGKSLIGWYASNGAINSFSFLEREMVENAEVFRFRVQLGKNPYRFSFKINKDGKIAQIYCW